jgi:TRAP-type C4-dicarboxylate transport system substrate-binding protein
MSFSKRRPNEENNAINIQKVPVMKSRVYIIALASVLTLIFVFFITDYRAHSQEQVVIKIATLAPGSGDWMNNFKKAIQEVEQRTNGRVTVKVYPGGVMGNDSTIFRKMQIGQLDGASFTAGGISVVYPDFQILSIPLLFRNYEEVDYIRTIIDPIITKNLEEKGYISLFMADAGFVYLMSAQPVENITSLKGLKIWIPEGDPIGRTVFEMAGVPPIPLPISDVLTALRTGLIDTVSNTPSGALLLQWFSQVKYFTDMPLLYAYGTFVLSKKSYEKIPVGDRQIVRDIIKEKMSVISESIRRYDQNSIPALKKRMQFIEISDKARVETEAFAERVRNKLVEDKYFSREMVDKITGALNEYREKKKK